MGARGYGVRKARVRLCFLISDGAIRPQLCWATAPAVDFVDVDSEKWADYAATKSFPARQIYRREARQLLRFDRRVAAKADASMFVSEAEAELFRKRAPELREKVFAIPNGIDSTYFSPEERWTEAGFGGTPVIVFTGHMDYWPNVEAVVWFSDNVLPKLRQRFPGAIFYIVGSASLSLSQSAQLAAGYYGHRSGPRRPTLCGACGCLAWSRRCAIGRGIETRF